MTRREKLLGDLDLKTTRGVEIGPLMSPLVGKDEGEIYYVDHADRETLQAKYANDPNVDIEKIVAVDAVWGDRTLRECLSASGADFDYVIASHVVEHVPDFLGWLCEIADILQLGGRLILAIPDKRFTFDYLRQPTRLSEIVDAYLRRNRRPMPAQLFDYNANAVDLDLVAAWESRIDPKSLRHYVDLRFALERSVESIREEKYIDAHCWVFTAHSLAAILSDLVELDLLPYSCLHLSEPERNTNEITLILERWHGGSPSEKERARMSFIAQVHRLDELDTLQEQSRLPSSSENVAVGRDTQMVNEENAVLLEQIVLLRSQIATMTSSRSFRITRPLRELRAWTSSLISRRFSG